MKKIVALAAAALVSVAGAFAFDLGGIQGTWQDNQYDANWTFRADGKLVLSLISTGEVVYTFTEDNVQNPDVKVLPEGIALTFRCAETHRAYTFLKPADLTPNLQMTIVRDWRKGEYRKTIKLVRD